MQRLFRNDYEGEWVVKTLTISGGITQQEREWVPNSVQNINHTGHAVVFGNGTSRLDYDYVPAFHHRGGLMGKKKIQTYGCNALYRDQSPNFLIVTSEIIAKEVNDAKYDENNTVYARANQVLNHPKSFHLIPHDDFKDAGATALRLACFDGHRKVYMVGFDTQNLPGQNNNVYANTHGYGSNEAPIDDKNWTENWLEVMNTYHHVDFIRVTHREDYPLPETLKYANNLRSISFRDFVFEVDLGC